MEEVYDRNNQRTRFNEFSLKIQNLNRRKDDRYQDDLSKILDELNGLDYHSKFVDEEPVASLLQQCCHLIPVRNEELVIKLCWLILNTLNRQKLVLVHNINTVMDFILKALHECSSKVASFLLRALSTTVYENAGKTSKYHDNLLGSSGILPLLANINDVDVRRAAIQCLENITLRTAGDTVYLSEVHQKACVESFLKTLQTQMPIDIIQCKVLISIFKGLQNLLIGQKSFPSELTGYLLAALQVYIVYGQPGAPAVIPSCLYSVPLAQYEPKTPGARDTPVKESHPIDSEDQPSNSKTKSGAKKNRKNRNKNKKTVEQDVNEDGQDSFMESTSLMESASGSGMPGFWASLGSSDSDYSDTEGGTAAKLHSSVSRVRINALACFHALIKVVEKRIMFGYWPSFIPDTSDTAAITTKFTLLTVISKDSSHKVRCAGLGVLSCLLDGSKPFLMAAEDADQYRNAPFTPFYVTVGYMIKEIHRCLLLVLASEPSAIVITQVIKCLATLIVNVPYQRLRPGLLSRIVRQIRPYLSHRDPNIRVACLTCLGNIVSVHAPMIEVYQVLISSKPSNRSSEQLPGAGPKGSSLNHSLNPDVSTLSVSKESGYSSVGGLFSPGVTTPILTSGSRTPAVLDQSFSGESEVSWTVKLCLRNITPLLAEKLKPETEEPNLSTSVIQPLPVRLESLQLLAQIAKGYFIILRPHLEVMRNLIHLCLQDQDCAVRLHGAKVLDMIGSMILHQHQQPTDSIIVTVEQALEFWLPLLSGPIQNVLHDRSVQTVMATVCDCLSNIGPSVFEKLPQDKAILCITLLLGLAGDEDHHVKAAAIRALGCYIVYPCLREDVLFVADTANVLILASSEPDVPISVRWRAAWSLSNLSDALLLNKSDGNEEFMNGFSQMLLTKLFETAIKLCSDNEKARSNGVRTLGNLLRYLPEKCCDIRHFRDLIDESISVIVKNVVTGTVKVRWNASYAVGNIFRNKGLHRYLEPHLTQVFSALVSSIKSCKNFKVRISATTALAVPSERVLYGDPQQYVSIWEGLVTVLMSLEGADVDFSEFRYQSNLTEQVCKTMMHLATLVMEEDLNLLLDNVLRMQSDFISLHLERFHRSTDKEGDPAEKTASVPLPDVMMHLDELKAKEQLLTGSQMEAIDLLQTIFSLLESSTSQQGFDEHVPLSSGFRQMYD